MAKTINILAPELGFGTFGMAKVQVEILDGLTPISTRLYYFNIAEFSSYSDSTNVNWGSLHFGQHQISLSNGEYSIVQYNGGTVTNSYLAVYEVSEAIAQLVP